MAYTILDLLTTGIQTFCLGRTKPNYDCCMFLYSWPIYLFCSVYPGVPGWLSALSGMSQNLTKHGDLICKWVYLICFDGIYVYYINVYQDISLDGCQPPWLYQYDCKISFGGWKYKRSDDVCMCVSRYFPDTQNPAKSENIQMRWSMFLIFPDSAPWMSQVGWTWVTDLPLSEPLFAWSRSLSVYHCYNVEVMQMHGSTWACTIHVLACTMYISSWTIQADIPIWFETKIYYMTKLMDYRANMPKNYRPTFESGWN